MATRRRVKTLRVPDYKGYGDLPTTVADVKDNNSSNDDDGGKINNDKNTNIYHHQQQQPRIINSTTA
eukprot:CAMPEP_0194192374 /NCGR_PEP_ID=MMETSP0154-20130528/70325_1 /TAXON_ID=1049557 /ORGANISM="Thalassiothrix antarctica, Strain L6-D1" /LENGTH=66 /DNA_ID=CAMNT_0038915749 /DNA_START=25 /DNA_END=222 /DNA_ORIENTATION=+